MDTSALPVAVGIVMIFAIPIVAIIGGITAGVLKTRGQQRLMELAQRERIAAIERGLDLAKLPPLPVIGDDPTAMHRLAALLPTPRQAEQQRAQGFLITGLILLAIGLGLSTMLLVLPEAAANRAWAAGIIPIFIGLALLATFVVVRRGASADTKSADGPRA